jgi:hypothetical protein
MIASVIAGTSKTFDVLLFWLDERTDVSHCMDSAILLSEKMSLVGEKIIIISVLLLSRTFCQNGEQKDVNGPDGTRLLQELIS